METALEFQLKAGQSPDQPGTGLAGNAAPNSLSGTNTFAYTTTYEWSPVWEYALEMATRIPRQFDHAGAHHNLIFLKSRETVPNVYHGARHLVAFRSGADLYLSVHFNSACNLTARGVLNVVTGNDAGAAQLNYEDDLDFGEYIKDAVADTMDFSDRGTETRGSGFPNTRDNQTVAPNHNFYDPGLGNRTGYTPLRAAVIEIEFMSNSDVDEFFWCPYLCCIRPLTNGRPPTPIIINGELCVTLPAIDPLDACNEAQLAASDHDIRQHRIDVAQTLSDAIMAYITGYTGPDNARVLRYPVPGEGD